MSIDFNDDLLALWYVELPNDSNWLAGISRDDTGKGHLRYRFRYYVDQKAFESKDVKNWYGWTGDLVELTATTHRVYKSLLMHGGTHYYAERNGRTTAEFMEEFMTWHITHAKKLTKEEFDELQRRDQRS